MFEPNLDSSSSTQPSVNLPSLSYNTNSPFITHYDHNPWIPITIPMPSSSGQDRQKKRKAIFKPHKLKHSNLFPTKKLSFPFRKKKKNSLERSLTRTGRTHWTPAKRKQRKFNTVKVSLPNIFQEPRNSNNQPQIKPQIRRQDNILTAAPKEGLAELFALSVIGSILAL